MFPCCTQGLSLTLKLFLCRCSCWEHAPCLILFSPHLPVQKPPRKIGHCFALSPSPFYSCAWLIVWDSRIWRAESVWGWGGDDAPQVLAPLIYTLPVWVHAWKQTKNGSWMGGFWGWQPIQNGNNSESDFCFIETFRQATHAARTPALTSSSSISRSQFAGGKQYGGSWGGGWRMIAHAQSSCCSRLISLSEHF